MLYDYGYTYWGSMLRNMGMSLCVDNAWSGDSLGSGRFVGRVQQLHNNANETPDLIVAYFGINDTWGEGRNAGNLLSLLENKGSATEEEIVKEWLDGVLAKAEANNYAVSDAQNWDELYAIMLHLMTKKYPNAKVVCVGLTYNGGKADYPSADKWVPQYNEIIKVLSGYFDVLYADQISVINDTNYQSYMHDDRMLHPNANGHRVIFEQIVKALYEDLKK